MKILYFLLIIFYCYSCKQSNQNNVDPKISLSKTNNILEDSLEENSTSSSINDSLINFNQNLLNKIYHDSIPITDSIPFGEKGLVDIDFPENWELYSKTNAFQKKYDTIYFRLQKIFDSYKSPDRFENINFTVLEKSLINSNVFLNKEESSNPKWRIVNVVSKLPNKLSNNIYICTGTTYDPLLIWADILVINKDGEINSLNIYKYKEYSYNTEQKLFYIDSDYKIHIKEFSGDEENNKFQSYSQYNISLEGRFKKVK